MQKERCSAEVAVENAICGHEDPGTRLRNAVAIELRGLNSSRQHDQPAAAVMQLPTSRREANPERSRPAVYLVLREGNEPRASRSHVGRGCGAVSDERMGQHRYFARLRREPQDEGKQRERASHALSIGKVRPLGERQQRAGRSGGLRGRSASRNAGFHELTVCYQAIRVLRDVELEFVRDFNGLGEVLGVVGIVESL